MAFKNTIATFWSRVDVRGADECWMWSGGTDKDGYGKFKLDGRHRRTHQIAFEEHHGPVPKSNVVCHRCDTPGCCNPRHLFPGTVIENNEDRDRKGRAARLQGEKHGISKLTDDQVYAIRADFRNINVVAAEYGVSKGTISEIRNFKRWRHLTCQPPSPDPNNSPPAR